MKERVVLGRLLLAQGRNEFTYVGGSPLGFADPTGLQVPLPPGGGAAGGAGGVGGFGGLGGFGGSSGAGTSRGGYNPITDMYTPLPPPSFLEQCTLAVQSAWDKIQKDLDHKNYHKTCDREPPEPQTPCERARWTYRQQQSCYDKRSAWEERWGDAQSKPAHERALKAVKRALANAANDIRNFCPAP